MAKSPSKARTKAPAKSPKSKPAKASAPSKGSSKAKGPAKSAPAKPKAPAKGPSRPAAKDAKSPPAKAGKAGPPAPTTKSKAVPEPKAKPGSKAATPAKDNKPQAAPAKPGAPAPGQPGKPQRKGITIVSQKPVKKPKAPPTSPVLPQLGVGILGPGAPKRKPLIPSGPKAPVAMSLTPGADDGKKKKSPFNKRELDRFRDILIRKRSELVGDVSRIEEEALRGQSGSLSNLPQHIAEQGTEASDQSLSLDLAAADRKLIKEIDDALKRIAEGSYGLCELTGRPINKERLEELPWARFSIEAAREFERRSFGL